MKQLFPRGIVILAALNFLAAAEPTLPTGVTPTPADGGTTFLSLERAYELTIRNNTAIKVAREQLRQADLLTGKAWTYLAPQVTAGYTAIRFSEAQTLSMFNFAASTYQIVNNPDGTANFIPVRPVFESFDFQPETMELYTLQVDQPILAGQVFPAIGMARDAYRLQQEVLRLTKANLIYAVTQIYNGALTAREFVRISDRNAVSLREHARIARRRFELGQVNKIELLRAELEMAEAEKKYGEAQNLYRGAVENLIVLTGYDRAKLGDFELIASPPLQRPAGDAAALEQEALDSRGELKISRLALEISKGNKNLTWSKFLPLVAAQWKYTHQPTPTAFTKEDYWQLTGMVSLSIFQGGQRFFELCEKQSAIDQAEFSLEGTANDVLLSVRNAWREMNLADADLENARRTVQLAREGAAIAARSYEKGLITSLDAIDANSRLLLAELGFASETFRHDTKILALLLALGRLPEAAGVADNRDEPLERETDREESGRPSLGGEIPLPATAPTAR